LFLRVHARNASEIDLKEDILKGVYIMLKELFSKSVADTGGGFWELQPPYGC
jgi:hypothetical protein